MDSKRAMFVSIPHAGEQVGEEAFWLKGLDEVTLMFDVDRFIDQIYQPAIEDRGLLSQITPWHRYMVDCNRWPTDVDVDSVEESENPSGTHPTGLHWRVTMGGHVLIQQPISQELHKKILQKYYFDFFKGIEDLYAKFKEQGHKTIYHLDLHSMPYRGMQFHRDPGQDRSDIVIGNERGQTASLEWTHKVKAAYEEEGFSVKLNDPYTGGTIVEKFGKPSEGREALMIELNRKLYMDEKTKKLIPEKAKPVQARLVRVFQSLSLK